MSDAEIKLELIRLIDRQEGQSLRALYDLLQKRTNTGAYPTLEAGYKAMSEDTAREEEALEWAEGTLNTEEL